MQYELSFVEWREGLRNGKLLGLKCQNCGTVTCPPRKVCRECEGENFDVVEIKKKGKINTFTTCYSTPTGFDGPYVVAIADLEEGGRVMGNVIDIDPDTVTMDIIDKEVRIGFKEISGDFMTGQDTRVALTFQLVDGNPR